MAAVLALFYFVPLTESELLAQLPGPVWKICDNYWQQLHLLLICLLPREISSSSKYSFLLPANLIARVSEHAQANQCPLTRFYLPTRVMGHVTELDCKQTLTTLPTPFSPGSRRAGGTLTPRGKEELIEDEKSLSSQGSEALTAGRPVLPLGEISKIRGTTLRAE